MDTELVQGDLGEFTVWVEGQKVASKWLLFPSERRIVKAVRSALGTAAARA